MKSPFPILAVAVLVAASLLNGCASASREPPDTGRTLEADHVFETDLPLLAGSPVAAGLFDRAFVGPVKGLSPRGVMQRLGAPTQRLTPNLWIYWQYSPAAQAAGNDGHDTLVVAFARGEVIGMKLVNGEELRTQLARRPAVRL